MVDTEYGVTWGGTKTIPEGECLDKTHIYNEKYEKEDQVWSGEIIQIR